MYVILPLYGFSIPAEMENGSFLYREPKNLGVRKKKDRQEILPVTRNVQLSPDHAAFMFRAVLQDFFEIQKHRAVFASSIAIADIVVVVADDL